MAEDRVNGNGRARGRERTAARLAAIQALYQIELTGAPAEGVIAEFTTGKRPEPYPDMEEDAPPDLGPPDPGLFGATVRGVIAKRAVLDEMIGGALTAEWTVDRLEILVRLILEAGVWELTERGDIPPRASISEYLNIAHAFYDGAEPGFINGVLDAIARSYRATDMARARG